MATGIDKLREHMACALCLETIKVPKMLTCQHTYCKICLENLLRNAGPRTYEITCPECRAKTNVPLGGISKLPDNLLMKKFLLCLSGEQSVVKPSCNKHEGERLKLYCKTCEVTICTDCTLIDHKDHKYQFVEDIYPSVKEEIEAEVNESRKKIFAIKKSLETIDERELVVDVSCNAVSSKIDAFIDEQIQLLKEKQQRLKGELQELAQVQKRHQENQKGSLAVSLKNIKGSVEFAEQALRRGNKIEVVSARNQIIQQFTNVNSAITELKPRGTILYDLEISSAQVNEMTGVIANIREYDEEYNLTMTPESWDLSSRINFGADFCFFSSQLIATQTFILRCKSSNTAYGPVHNVKVKIKETGSNEVNTPEIQKKEDGSFLFRFKSPQSGKYDIDVLVNERYVKGSPFRLMVR